MTVKVNGIAVETDGAPSAQFAAARELLRQRAVETGLLSDKERGEDKIARAVEQLLVREVGVPEPTPEECRRYYEAHRRDFRSGDLVHARHILFQVTPHVSLAQIRAHAERTLGELLAQPDLFATRARELSNCPSGSEGGNLGQIGRGDTVPEFERALFRIAPEGIVPELVKTRFGFHIVSIDRSIPGADVPYEEVRDRVAESLRTAVEERALKQYISLLAGAAEIVGVEIDAASSPLVQ